MMPRSLAHSLDFSIPARTRASLTGAFCAVLVLGSLVGCSEPAPREPSPPNGARESVEHTSVERTSVERTSVEGPTVAALSPPVAWLVRRLGGDDIVVLDVTPPGADPRTWQPSAETIVALQDADLIVAHGAGYEAWLATASLPPSRLVRTADGLDLIAAETVRHRHGDGDAHSHDTRHVETWLDPDLLLRQAETVAGALGDLPVDGVDARLEDLRADLGAVRAEAEAALAPLAGRPLAAAAPAYAYLARRFDLDIESLDLPIDGPPDDHARHHLERWLERRLEPVDDPPILLWPEAPSDAVRSALPASIRHVVVDPLAVARADDPEHHDRQDEHDDEGYDFLRALRTELEHLAAAGADGDAPSGDRAADDRAATVD